MLIEILSIDISKSIRLLEKKQYILKCTIVRKTRVVRARHHGFDFFERVKQNTYYFYYHAGTRCRSINEIEDFLRTGHYLLIEYRNLRKTPNERTISENHPHIIGYAMTL